MGLLSRNYNAQKFYAINAYPVGVMKSELYRRAKMEFFDPEKDSAEFVIRVTFGVGDERDDLTLNPGDIIPLRGQAEVDHVRVGFRDHAVAILEDLDDEAETIRRSLTAIRPVETFYRQRGAMYAKKMMREAKIQRDEYDEYRDAYYPYWLNEAKSEILREHIKALEARLREVISAPPEPARAAAPAPAVKLAVKKRK